MIAPEILKKHNLKAVPFSCIGEGETFNAWATLDLNFSPLAFYERRLKGERVFMARGNATIESKDMYVGSTVYVPVWRPTIKGEVL